MLVVVIYGYGPFLVSDPWAVLIGAQGRRMLSETLDRPCRSSTTTTLRSPQRLMFLGACQFIKFPGYPQFKWLACSRAPSALCKRVLKIAEVPFVLDLLRLFVAQLRCGFVGGDALSGPGIVSVKLGM